MLGDKRQLVYFMQAGDDQILLIILTVTVSVRQIERCDSTKFMEYAKNVT